MKVLVDNFDNKKTRVNLYYSCLRKISNQSNTFWKLIIYLGVTTKRNEIITVS